MCILAPTCTPIVFPPSIPYHLVSLWLPCDDCCVFRFPRVLTSSYTCFSRDFCFHVVFTCFNITCFDITCFNISFVHKRLGYLPQTRPRADCCTSWELVPALLQPHVGRFFLCFCIAPRAASPFFSCLQARPRADCCTPDTWQFDFFYHRSFHIKHPSYYFSIVVQPRAAIVVSFLCNTCTFCMWGIPYLWIARSLPIPPFPARFTVFRILSCFSHSYLLYLAYVWYLHVPVLHMFSTALSWPYRLAPDTLQHLPRFHNSTCILHLAHSAWLVVFWCTFFLYTIDPLTFCIIV